MYNSDNDHGERVTAPVIYIYIYIYIYIDNVVYNSTPNQHPIGLYTGNVEQN